MKNEKRKLASFDIDGTVFRSSLLIKLIEVLIELKVFPDYAKAEYLPAYEKWMNRQGSYDDYIKAVVAVFEKNIKGVANDVLIKASHKVVEDNKYLVYRYTRDLIAELKAKDYFLVAISHSPKEIVQIFCEIWGFDKVYGRMYEIDKDGKFTSGTLYLDLISDKAKILQRVVEKENLTLEDSIAVGDSEGDISILAAVSNPICFNPNQALCDYAKANGWPIVVERKDVIHYI